MAKTTIQDFLKRNQKQEDHDAHRLMTIPLHASLMKQGSMRYRG